MPAHSHGDVSHDHPDAAPGHTHDPTPETAPVSTTPPPGEPTEPVAGPTAAPSAAGVATTTFILRAVLTVAGAAGIIGGAFLGWLQFDGQTGAEGTRAPVAVFWSNLTDVDPATFTTSAGLVLIVLGLAALIGLALPTGWLTRLAGALAIIAFGLFLISIIRVSAEDVGVELGLGNVGIGMWLILAGGVLAVVGGFFGARPRPVAMA
ncbi:MAG TPA: hypothetical protein VHL78_05740 [Actinomycetota bacterium]|nr:hypothetical protein [Actinomycetota bacterium]